MEEIQVDEGFWVVVNPEPLQLMFMIPISDDERDYLEWLDDHDKGGDIEE